MRAVTTDGLILYDKDGFFSEFRKKIRKISSEAGLHRKKDGEGYYWQWENPPKGGWEITWGGYREL